MKMKSTLLAAAAVGMMMAGAAYAHTPADPDAVGNIAKLASKANLIVHAKVKRVDYKIATSKSGAEKIPYTLVTFDLQDVLQGTAKSKSLTLSFVGGADGKGGFLDVEGVPIFNVGNEDVLFVAGNSGGGCALVNCEFGRYRILDGKVYEAHGSPARAIKDGRIKTSGQGPAALDSYSYPGNGTTYTINIKDSLDLPAGAAARAAESTSSVSVADLKSEISATVKKQARRDLKTVESVSLAAEIVINDSVAAAP